MFGLSKRSVHNMEGVDPEVQLVIVEALKVSPIDFGIPNDGGVRTADRQLELFEDGRSKCDGYAHLSNHQIVEGEEFGRAVDFYAYLNGKASWDKVHLAIIAGVILSTAKRLRGEGRVSIDLTWGGTFGSDSFEGWDYPHIEVSR